MVLGYLLDQYVYANKGEILRPARAPTGIRDDDDAEPRVCDAIEALSSLHGMLWPCCSVLFELFSFLSFLFFFFFLLLLLLLSVKLLGVGKNYTLTPEEREWIRKVCCGCRDCDHSG